LFANKRKVTGSVVEKVAALDGTLFLNNDFERVHSNKII